MKKYLELILMLISGTVAVWLFINHAAPWHIICIYWTVLTIKNTVDVIRTRRNK